MIYYFIIEDPLNLYLQKNFHRLAKSATSSKERPDPIAISSKDSFPIVNKRFAVSTFVSCSLLLI